MRLYAFLTLATCVLHARSATVPKLDVSDLQKKLAVVAQEAAKKEVLPIENTPSQQELTEQEISVNEVQNNIKRVKIPGIPVKVVVEDIKPLKVDSLEDIELDDGLNIKRVEVDLKNPGAPQRQEHETQNPEHFEEPADNLKQTVADAQNNMQEGLQGVSQGIQDWIANNEQVNNIQQSLQSLQENFKEQLSKLNQTVQSFLPQPSKPANPSEKKAFESIDSTLRTLEATFQKTIDQMSDGVKAYAIFAPTLRQAAEGGSTTTGGPASGGSSSNNNIFLQYLQALQSTISQGFANVTTTIQNSLNANGSGNGSNNTAAGPGSFISGIGSGIQNIFNQNSQSSTPAGSQSDESGSTTARPGWPIWQGIQSSLQNILNPGQNQAGQNGQADQPATIGPIAQAIQNNPIVQAVGNFIQPNRPGAQQPASQAPTQASPTESAQSADQQSSASQEGSNAVPASDANPVSSEQKKPEEGPIKKIIQNNSIMKGISGAVQKIQSLGNPEKPRDTLEGEVPEQEKGILVIDKHHGGNHGPNTGDNNHIDRSGEVAKSEPVKVEPEILPEEPKEDKESIDKQPQTAIKTD